MDMLEDLLDNIDVAAFIIDKNGKYLYVFGNHDWNGDGLRMKAF